MLAHGGSMSFPPIPSYDAWKTTEPCPGCGLTFSCECPPPCAECRRPWEECECFDGDDDGGEDAEL